jgi:type I restriction enzyme S subunit
MATSQDFVNWVCTPAIDYRFLKYVLLAEKDTLLQYASGTTHQTIYFPEVKAFHVCLPQPAEQGKIVEVLGALDDRIELNRRMAETVEAMVLALFRSWFVDFDPVRAKSESHNTGLSKGFTSLFPKGFAENGLPMGWSTRPFSDLFDISGGNTPRTENTALWGGRHQWATPKDLSGLFTPVLLQTGRQLTDAGLGQAGSGLLPPGSLLLSTRAPIGYIAFIARPTAINQGFAGIVRKQTSPAYAWGWCRINMDVIAGNAGGSTFPEISKAVLRQLPMLAPPQAVLDAFGSIVDPLVDRIVAAAKQSETLTELRDTLLPRLISGELRIADVGKQIAAA